MQNGNNYDSNGNIYVRLGASIAGESTNTSLTDYLRVKEKCNLAVVSKTTAVTIGAGGQADTMLLGVTVVAALTGTCVITGFADSDGTAQSITFPAGTTAGFKDFKGSVNSAGALTFTCSNALDDNLVLVHWAAV